MTARVVALLPAGGAGARMGGRLPKQLVKLAGREILAHTLDVFEAASSVDEIRVFVPPQHVSETQELVATYGYRKVRGVAAGGTDRAASVRAGLTALAEYDGDTKVLVHDAVRPLVPVATVDACAAALDEHEAVTVAVPSTDTIVEVDAPGKRVTDIPDRSRLRRVQTPQAFRLRVLAEAHDRAAADADFTPTDDCGVVRRYLPHMAIGIVPGSEDNLKITYPADLQVAEARLRNRTL